MFFNLLKDIALLKLLYRSLKFLINDRIEETIYRLSNRMVEIHRNAKTFPSAFKLEAIKHYENR